MEEDLFKGNRLGVDADIATGDMRQSRLRRRVELTVFPSLSVTSDLLRSLAHLPEGFLPPERFMDQVALHLAKNALFGSGQITRCQVPLIMAIWGEKGCGKTFNLELCLKIMGVLPIIISAGDLSLFPSILRLVQPNSESPHWLMQGSLKMSWLASQASVCVKGLWTLLWNPTDLMFLGGCLQSPKLTNVITGTALLPATLPPPAWPRASSSMT